MNPRAAKANFSLFIVIGRRMKITFFDIQQSTWQKAIAFFGWRKKFRRSKFLSWFEFYEQKYFIFWSFRWFTLGHDLSFWQFLSIDRIKMNHTHRSMMLIMMWKINSNVSFSNKYYKIFDANFDFRVKLCLIWKDKIDDCVSLCIVHATTLLSSWLV